MYMDWCYSLLCTSVSVCAKLACCIIVLVVGGCYWGPPQNNSLVHGGFGQVGIGTVSSCQAKCENTTGCTGIDWDSARVPFQYKRCWLIFGGVAAFAYDVTHYDFICSGELTDPLTEISDLRLFIFGF